MCAQTLSCHCAIPGHLQPETDVQHHQRKHPATIEARDGVQGSCCDCQIAWLAHLQDVAKCHSVPAVTDKAFNGRRL